jgi:Ca-activated chloride channel family protein
LETLELRARNCYRSHGPGPQNKSTTTDCHTHNRGPAERRAARADSSSDASRPAHAEPPRAAQLAAREGLKIYTIGIGADEMLVRQLFGTIKVNPSTDLDEATLRALADATGGRYFRARDVNSLQEIYAELDRLEPVAREQEHFRPVHSLFIWPLGGALVLAAGMLLHRAGRRR